MAGKQHRSDLTKWKTKILVFSLARLAFVFIDIYLSSIIEWFYVFITQYIDTNVLCHLYFGFSYSSYLDNRFPTNLHHRKKVSLFSGCANDFQCSSGPGLFI